MAKSYTFPDGTVLLTDPALAHEIFDDAKLIGKTITDIRPFCYDYIVRNMDDLDYSEIKEFESSMCTDELICFDFSDGTSLEIYFSGEGPVRLGINTAKSRNYPSYNGRCYKLSTLFSDAINARIMNIEISSINEPLFFPEYMGIDVSSETCNISGISLVLDNEKKILMRGNFDWFDVIMYDADGKETYVPIKPILDELYDPPYDIYASTPGGKAGIC